MLAEIVKSPRRRARFACKHKTQVITNYKAHQSSGRDNLYRQATTSLDAIDLDRDNSLEGRKEGKHFHVRKQCSQAEDDMSRQSVIGSAMSCREPSSSMEPFSTSFSSFLSKEWLSWAGVEVDVSTSRAVISPPVSRSSSAPGSTRWRRVYPKYAP